MSDTPTELVRIRNVSPCKALEVPLLRGRIVKRGEIIEVSPEHAERLTRQSIWQRIDDAGLPAKSASKKAWAQQAAAMGIPVGDQTKDQIIATVEAALENKE